MTDSQAHGAITIREMRLADLTQVKEIDDLSFALPWPESAYRFEINDNPGSFLWVAEIELPSRRIVGFIVVWLILDEAHIATIAVHPDFRGRGIGAQLLAHALQAAIQQGEKQATLEVRASNLVAQQLYRRFHFEVVGSRPRYYRDNQEDALIMTVGELNEHYRAWLDSRLWQKVGSQSGNHPGSKDEPDR